MGGCQCRSIPPPSRVRNSVRVFLDRRRVYCQSVVATWTLVLRCGRMNRMFLRDRCIFSYGAVLFSYFEADRFRLRVHTSGWLVAFATTSTTCLWPFFFFFSISLSVFASSYTRCCTSPKRWPTCITTVFVTVNSALALFLVAVAVTAQSLEEPLARLDRTHLGIWTSYKRVSLRRTWRMSRASLRLRRWRKLTLLFCIVSV